MLVFTIISTILGLGAAFAIPHANIDTRETHSIPSLTNYTGSYLNNQALQPPIACNTTAITIPFPSILKVNVTKCRDLCNALWRTPSKWTPRCRSFNAYMMFEDGVNQGLQYALYDRKVDDFFATNNGTRTEAGGLRPGVSSGTNFTIVDSYAYYLTIDSGDQSCGKDKSSNSVKVTTAPTIAPIPMAGSVTAPASINSNPAAVLNGATDGIGMAAPSSVCHATVGITTHVVTITLTSTTTGSRCITVPVTTTTTTAPTIPHSTTSVVHISASAHTAASASSSTYAATRNSNGAQNLGMTDSTVIAYGGQHAPLAQRGGRSPIWGGSGSMPQHGGMGSGFEV